MKSNWWYRALAIAGVLIIINALYGLATSSGEWVVKVALIFMGLVFVWLYLQERRKGRG